MNEAEAYQAPLAIVVKALNEVLPFRSRIEEQDRDAPTKPCLQNLKDPIFRLYDLTTCSNSWSPKTKETTKDNLKRALAEVWETLGMGNIEDALEK
jgi:hypothetical protein